MSGDDIAQLLLYGTFLTVIGGAVILQMRHRMGEVAKGAAIWVLIFLGAILAVGLWEDIHGTVSPQMSVNTDAGVVTLPRSPDGHYYATLEVNGTPTRFVVDTGATAVVLTQADTEAAGIDLTGLAFLGSAMTANGVVRTAPVTLQTVSLGGIEDRGLRAFVNEGDMRESLLGMDYLQRFEAVEIRGGEMRLVR
ncbi:retropepsin-like aspartic protease family protein [Pseudaestuariivita sp.]|uniref:retropepsin-like aspartic protease family protein n=1 Tax=Pseudaestuariivita sp. TaxID=2211669 RepID=UPI00405854C1